MMLKSTAIFAQHTPLFAGRLAQRRSIAMEQLKSANVINGFIMP
jgi:hypothetical protein